MFIINKYDDGSASYAYEAGDEVILKSNVQLRDLHGYVHTEYKVGDKVTITGRSGNTISLIPELLSFYRFNHHFDSFMGSHFEPADPEQAKDKPLAFVVPWYDGRMQKYILVAARTPDEAVKICFSAKYFTKERMKGIKIGEIFEKGDWQLPDGSRWFAVLPLR